MKAWAFLVVVVLASGCAVHPAQQGLNYMNAGNYQAAFKSFYGCALSGDPYCMNNMGVMYQRGHMKGGVNLNMAAEYYTQAARYGIQIAQQNLRSLGKPVPPADLQAAYELRLARQQQAAANSAAALGCALAGGCAQSMPTQTVVSPSLPTGPVNRPLVANPKATPAGCNTDFDCGTGNKCVRPAGTYGLGQCITPVDDYGIPTYEPIIPSGVPTDVSSCQFSTDCPAMFECRKKPGEIYGLCTKF